jgi:hypothetical protein
MALNSEIYEKFRIAFEQKCLQLIVEAHQTSINGKTISLNWNENDISSELHRITKANPLRQKWRVSTNVEEHITKETVQLKGFANKLPRIDFRMTSFISFYEYNYYFEAKNLKQNSHALKRRYIDTGINNFVSQKYPKGSLIGYLLEGKTDETVRGINSLLEEDKRHSEKLNHCPNKLLGSFYESFHPNINKLKHLILDFTDLPA